MLQDAVAIDDEAATENCMQLVLGMYVVACGILAGAKPEAKDIAAKARSTMNPNPSPPCHQCYLLFPFDFGPLVQ